MKFLKKIAGILGLGRDDAAAHGATHEDDGDEGGDSAYENTDQVDVEPIPGPRKGFSVPVRVAVRRSTVGPIVVPCDGDGGLQGFKWYGKRLRIDEDGDVADEFLDEVSPDFPSGTEEQQNKPPFPRFQVRYNARPAKVREQSLTRDGKFQQCVECQGRLQWV